MSVHLSAPIKLKKFDATTIVAARRIDEAFTGVETTHATISPNEKTIRIVESYQRTERAVELLQTAGTSGPGGPRSFDDGSSSLPEKGGRSQVSR